jgi:hypothetical protein
MQEFEDSDIGRIMGEKYQLHEVDIDRRLQEIFGPLDAALDPHFTDSQIGKVQGKSCQNSQSMSSQN